MFRLGNEKPAPGCPPYDSLAKHVRRSRSVFHTRYVAGWAPRQDARVEVQGRRAGWAKLQSPTQPQAHRLHPTCYVRTVTFYELGPKHLPLPLFRQGMLLHAAETFSPVSCVYELSTAASLLIAAVMVFVVYYCAKFR